MSVHPNTIGAPRDANLAEVLRRRAAEQPHRLAFTFLLDGEREEENLDYAELDRRARAVACLLQELGASGKRVLLLYPPGLDYVAAVFGCLYANAVAVLAFPPRLNRPTPRLEGIVADSDPKVVLTSEKIMANLTRRLNHTPLLERLHWAATDNLPRGLGAEWRQSEPVRDGLAFLQYTSGSTGAPKGVMISQANLMNNLALIEHGFGVDPEVDRGVIWLPIYHDMGLVGGILEPVFAGIPVTLMAPNSFLQRPVRWLRAMSRYGGTISGGPDFAYELCVEQVKPEARADLDLSGWRVAFCGAEPVRSATLDRFAEAFAGCGFRREAFYPCYGMAETTLIVSGGVASEAPVVRHVERSELERHRLVNADPEASEAQALVGCGRALPGMEVVIVDPENRRPCSQGKVGEIWVAGASVAGGYWRQPRETAETFGARLAGSDAGPYLRTGDLGHLEDGELFVTGRLKDLIIIRGNNHYPQDLELTVEQCHPALRRASGAAFSVELDGHEELVIVHEIERTAKAADAKAAIGAAREALAEQYGLAPAAVIIIRTLGLPKTSSGKVQRFASRQAFLAGELKIVDQWHKGRQGEAPAEPAAPESEADRKTPPATGTETSGDSPTAEAIREWLVATLADQLDLAPAEIDPREPFARYGLDSAKTAGLSGALEEWLGRRLDPTLPYEYPTLDELASHLAGVETGSRPPEPSAPRPLAAFASAQENERVAIIGIACRFPGAPDTDSFWRLLRDGSDAITEVPKERWDASRFYQADANAPGRINSRWGGFLTDIDRFDPHFFGITQREAPRIDPQQRLLLETAWEALEDAGQVPPELSGSASGVFVGISGNEYSRLQLRDPALIDLYGAMGNSLAVAANRLSYTFDFQGPSLAIDTACSSSLVAVHMACRSLHLGECDLALAAGANLILSPALTMSFSSAGALAADGRCKAFDARADGFVRSEGVGCLVLKRLSRALEDNDPIYAVIRGTAVNQDGRTNGLMAPSRWAQEAVLRRAYERAGVEPGQVDYVEAHGTGTLLGDPIEAKALGAVLGEGREEGKHCRIGSVKTNIGHLEAAAGIAGLIKVALALKHRWLPPNLHYEEPNPHIPFDRLPLAVQAQGTPWPENGGPPLAGVSSFGFGGTNAHVVVEAAPPSIEPVDSGTEDAPMLMALSARSPQALEARARDLQGILATGQPPHARDLAYTLGERRAHLDHRLAVVAQSSEELAPRLAAFLAAGEGPQIAVGHQFRVEKPKVAFLFCGQGPQRAGMGLELARREPVFRAVLEDCDRLLREAAGFSLIDELTAGEQESRLAETAVAQPALFALQVALARLWRHWGIVPDAVIGHSVGEVAAAHVAGALGFEDAVRLVAERGRAMGKATGNGRMAAVGLSSEGAAELVAGHQGELSVAAINAPSSSVLSGDERVLRQLLKGLDERGVWHQLLPVDYAFHSPQMEPFLAGFGQALAGLSPRPPELTLVSTVTGGAAEGATWDAAYWRRQIRQPVRFAEAVGELIERGYRNFVELGPHPVLGASVNECLAERQEEGKVLSSLRREGGEREAMLSSLGVLHCQGVELEWSKINPAGGRSLSLPTYPWQGERYWLEGAGDPSDAGWEQSATEKGTPAPHPLLGRALELQHLGRQMVWEGPLDPRALPYLLDHRFEGAVVVPAAAYLEMALAAAEQANLELRLSQVGFNVPLVLPEDASRRVQVVLDRDGEKRASFRIFSRPASVGAAWSLHASGHIGLATGRQEPAPAASKPIEIRARCGEEIAAADYYRQLAGRGLQYGPAFQGVNRLWRQNAEALGEVEAPAEVAAEAADYHVHPAVLDACGQVLFAAADKGDATRAYVPAALEEFTFHRSPGQRMWSHARLRAQAVDGGSESLVGDAWLLDEDGRMLSEVRGLRLQALDAVAPTAARSDGWFYQVAWQEARKTAPDEGRLPGTWIVFTDAGGVGESVAERLEAEGNRCLRVARGGSYEAPEEGRYRIRPGDEDDMREMLKGALSPAALPCKGVVHLWSLDGVAPEETDERALNAGELAGPRTVLYLLQELSKRHWMQPPRIWLATRASQSLAGEEGVMPAIAQAVNWGFGRTLAQEQPDFWGGLIDFDSAGTPEAEGRWLFGHLTAKAAETQVAVRGDKCYVARLAKRPAPAAERTLTARPDGSYLITGGLGGLGLQVARWLITRGARRLLLLGRSQLPPRRDWKAIDPKSRQAHQIRAIRELESLGASIQVVSVDIADERQVADFIAAFEVEAWPPIRGVVHAAGVLQDRTLLQLDAKSLVAVFRAKVLGGWLLHRLLDSQPLDFFVLFSSTASVLGSAGQANYAAANAFLDALAHFRRARGRPALAVNWGPWAEVGLATEARRRQALARQGITSIEPDQGLEILGQLIGQGSPQVGVLAIDWTRLFASFPEYRNQPFFNLVKAGLSEEDGKGAEAAPAEKWRSAYLATDGEPQRRRLLQNLVRNQVAQVVGLAPEKLDLRQPLNTLGIDSLMGLELRSRVEAEAGVKISVAQLFEGPSIERFAELLAAQLVTEGEEAAPAAPAMKSAEQSPPSSMITAIQEGGTRPPFFCVHPGALDARCYQALADGLGDEQPFIVLQPSDLDNYRSLEDGAEAERPLAEIAEDCIQAMATVQGQGPYRLGGWSMGGVLAFLIGQELVRRGEEVELLALFDSPALSSGEAPEDYDDAELLPIFSRFLGARIGKVLPLATEAFEGLDLNERFGLLLEAAKEGEVIPADSGLAQIRFLYQAYKNGLLTAVRQLWTVAPQSYPRTITFFRACDRLGAFEDLFPDTAERWRQASAGELVLHHVPGDHYTMLMDDNARVLASLLAESLGNTGKHQSAG